MKSDTARTCDCAVNSAWSNARLSRSAASRSSVTLASSRSSSASACVSWVKAPSGSAVPVLCASATALTAASRAALSSSACGDVALRQLAARGVDAVLDVGDRRGQGGDRAVDVGGRAVDGVEQRAGLTERGLRRADRVDQPALAARGPGDQGRGRW